MPPVISVPPMITAARTVISVRVPSTAEDVMELWLAAKSAPPAAAVNPHRMKPAIRYRSRFSPASHAASGLPPTRKKLRPGRVFARNTVNTVTSSSVMSVMGGNSGSTGRSSQSASRKSSIALEPPSLYRWVRPMTMVIVPRVTINELTRAFTTSRPLTRPTIPPAANDTRMEPAQPSCGCRPTASMPHSMTTAPMDRSS